MAAEKSKKPSDQRKEESKKWQSVTKNQTQIRQAKAFVISMMGEFTNTCQSKQVGLEARVGFSSNAGRGLIKEAKSIPADFLLIGGKKNRTNRYPFTIAKYCCDRVPDNCSLVLIKKSGQPPHNMQSNSIRIKENHQPSSRWPKEKNSPSSEDNKQIVTTSSPRTVLDGCEGESHSTEEDSSSFGESSITKSSSSVTSQFKVQPEFKKPMSPLRRISSFLRSPFDSSTRKKSVGFQHKEKHQPPPLRCFGYEEIASSTNYFHPGKISQDSPHVFTCHTYYLLCGINYYVNLPL